MMMIAFIITLGEIMWSLRLERSRLFYLAFHNEWHCVQYTTVDGVEGPSTLSILFISSFPNAPCFLPFGFRLFYAYELVEDDVGEEIIAQTSTAEQCRAVGSSVSKMASVNGPSIPSFSQCVALCAIHYCECQVG